MKRTYFRIRIMLMACGLGLAAVYMWQGLSLGWWGVPVDLPEARSGTILEVTVPIGQKAPGYLCDEFADENERAACLHRLIFEDRDMKGYAYGDLVDCGRERRQTDLAGCERSREYARRFVWEHWKKRKRAYVAFTDASEKAEWVNHLFIEPTADGSWRVDERTLPMLREPKDPEHYRLGDIIEIKWKRATTDDSRYGLAPGTMYLTLSNITGDFMIL